MWTLIFYAWVIIVLILSSIQLPGKDAVGEATSFRFDYLEHFFVYLLIPVLYYLSEGAWLNKLFKDAYYIFLIGLLFSVLLEIQQYYIESRSFNPVDLLLNVSGFLAGIPLGKKIAKISGIHF